MFIHAPMHRVVGGATRSPVHPQRTTSLRVRKGGSMSDIHEVGDALWYAQFDVNRENKVQCPVCFGDLTVVMILGNGDHVNAPCGYCSAGYEGPRGWAYEHTTVARAEVAVITE